MQETTSDDIWGGQILLVSNDTQLIGLYSQSIELLGGKISALPMEFSDSILAQYADVAAMVIHVTHWNDAQQESLKRAEIYCQSHQLPLLIRTDLASLDATLGAINYSNVEHILSDNIGDLFAALEHNIKHPISNLFGGQDNFGLSDLKKISRDVERVAKTLAQLNAAEKSGDAPAHPENTGASEQQTISDPIDPYPTVSEDQQPVTGEDIRKLIEARRMRHHYFEAALFSDPAWDMMLDLMAARLEERKVAVSSLCIAANVPPTTALRWIKTMTDQGIFLRKADEEDGRRIFIALNEDASLGMHRYFTAVRHYQLLSI
ncbi:MAG: hypothetical protein ABJO01_06805 [Parasphingorhabdus sp.]|uniref:hypothetical protein n=1 Tax=Parasphingorhabdus sp. TaxID=2709688 RepID=UPI003299B54D